MDCPEDASACCFSTICSVVGNFWAGRFDKPVATLDIKKYFEDNFNITPPPPQHSMNRQHKNLQNYVIALLSACGSKWCRTFLIYHLLILCSWLSILNVLSLD